MANFPELNSNSFDSPFEAPQSTNQAFPSLYGLSDLKPTKEEILNTPYNVTPLNKIEGIGRYLNSEAFPKLGYSMNDPNIEDKYYNETSVLSQAGNAVTQLFGQAGAAWDAQFSKIQQVKQIFGGPDEGFLTDQFEASEALRDAYPVFKSNKEVSGILGYSPFSAGAFSKWSNFAPNLGFTLGTAAGVFAENLVATAIIEGATGGAGTGLAAAKWVKSGYEAIRNIKNFANLSKIGRSVGTTVYEGTKALGSAGNILRGMEALKNGKTLNGTMHSLYGSYALFSNTAGEALVENANSVGELVRDLKNEFVERNGRDPDGEELAKMQEAAEGLVLPSSLGNIGILMASNFLQQTNAFKAGKSLSTLAISGSNLLAKQVEKKIVIDELTGLAKEAATKNTVQRMLKAAGSTGLSILSEGLEEAGQGIVAKSTQDYFKAKYYNKPVSWTDSLGVGYAYATTEQGMEEFWAGIVTGGLFTGGGYAKNRYYLAKDKYQLKKETGQTVDDLVKSQITDINENIIPLLKYNMASSKSMENLKYQAVLGERVKEAIEGGDEHAAEFYKNAGLVSAMFTAKTYGKDKLLLDHYKELAGLEKSDLAKYFETEEDNLDTKEEFERNITKLEKISKLVDKAAENFKNPFKKTTLADAKYAKLSAEEAQKQYIEDNTLYDAWQASQELLVQQTFMAGELQSKIGKVTANLQKTNVSFDLLSALITQTDLDQKENKRFDENNVEYLKKQKEIESLQKKYEELDEESKDNEVILNQLRLENKILQSSEEGNPLTPAPKDYSGSFSQRETKEYLNRKIEIEEEKAALLKEMEQVTGFKIKEDPNLITYLADGRAVVNLKNLGRKLFEREKLEAERETQNTPESKRVEQIALSSINYVQSVSKKLSDLKALRRSYNSKTREGRRFIEEKTNEIEILEAELSTVKNPKLTVEEKLKVINELRDEKDQLRIDPSILEGEDGINSISGILEAFDLLGRLKMDIDYSENAINSLSNPKKMSEATMNSFERIYNARKKLFENIKNDDTDTGGEDETTPLNPAAAEVKVETKTLINNPPDEEKEKTYQIGDTVYYEGKEYKITNVFIDEDRLIRFNIENEEEKVENLRKSKLSLTPVLDKRSAMEKRNTDLFPDKTDFGKFDEPVKIKDYFEIDGVAFATYTNKDGLVEVVIGALSDSDYMAYMRNKDSNDFTAKFDSTKATAANVKTMVSELQKLLPEGHRIMEDKSISTDGIKFTIKQLDFGYEIATDEEGNVLTTKVGINGASKRNSLGVSVNKTKEGKFDDVQVNSYDDLLKVQAALLPLLEKLGLTIDDIKWVSNNGVEASSRSEVNKLAKNHNGGTVQINFPIIKQVVKEETTEETTIKEPTEFAKAVEELRKEEQGQLAAAIPNIESYKVNGEIDKKLMTPEDLAAYEEIYDLYDQAITPLLIQDIEARRQKELTDLLPKDKVSNGNLDFNAALNIGIPEFYQQMLDMVKEGKNTIAGVKEKNAPLLQKLYNEGKLKDKKDVWLALNPKANEINAKYDAELEKLKPAKTINSIDADIKALEEKRQEELEAVVELLPEVDKNKLTPANWVKKLLNVNNVGHLIRSLRKYENISLGEPVEPGGDGKLNQDSYRKAKEFSKTYREFFDNAKLYLNTINAKFNAEIDELKRLNAKEESTTQSPEVKDINGIPQAYEGTKEENLDRLEEEELAELTEKQSVLEELEKLYIELEQPTVIKTEEVPAEVTEDLTEGDYLEEAPIEETPVEEAKNLGENLVQVVVETEVTPEELEELQEELDTETPEETTEVLVEAVKEDLKNNGTEIEKNPKSLLKRLVAKIKKVILGIVLAGSIYAGYQINSVYSIDNIESFGTRQLVKWGLLDPKEDTLELKKDTAVVNYNLSDSAYEDQVTKFEKLSQTKGGIWSYRNQWLNKTGFVYIPGMNNKNIRENKKVVYKGVEGIAHFLIMKHGANDLTPLTSDADLKLASTHVMAEVKPNDYVPVIRRTENGNIHLHFELGKNVKKGDLTPVKLRQTLVSDLDFDSVQKAEGFASAKSPTLRSTGQNFNSLLYSGSKDAYGKFSGGAAVFIFKDKRGNTVVREYSGSINGIRSEIETIKEQFGVTEDQLTIGFFDAGSYTGKVGAIKGSINPARYYDYNDEAEAGSSLMIPEGGNQLEASIGILALLSFLRRKKKNNEPITPDELTDLREAIQAIKNDIEGIKNKYAEKKRDVETYFSKVDREPMGAETESIEEVIFQNELVEPFQDQLNRLVKEIENLIENDKLISSHLNTEDYIFYQNNQALIDDMVLDAIEKRNEEALAAEKLKKKKDEKLFDAKTGFINAFNKFFSFGKKIDPDSVYAISSVLERIKYSIAPSWFEFKTKGTSMELRSNFMALNASGEFQKVIYRNVESTNTGRYNHLILNEDLDSKYKAFQVFDNQYSMHLDFNEKNANKIAEVLFDFVNKNPVYAIMESSYNLARPDNVRIYSKEELTPEQLNTLKIDIAKIVDDEFDNPLIGDIKLDKLPSQQSFKNTINLIDKDLQTIILDYLNQRDYAGTYKNGLSLEALKAVTLFSKVYKEYKRTGEITDESIIAPIVEMQIKKTKLYGEIKEINDSLQSNAFDDVRGEDFFKELLNKASKKMKELSTFNFGMYNLSIDQTVYNGATGVPLKIVDHTLLSKGNKLTLGITLLEGTKEIFVTPFEFKNRYSTEPIIKDNDFDSQKGKEKDEADKKDENKYPNTLTTTISNDDETFYGKDTVDENIAIGKLAIQKLDENPDDDYFVTVQSPDFDDEESPFFISATGDYNPNVPTDIQDLYREGNLKNFQGLTEEERNSLLAQGIKGFGKIAVLTNKKGEYTLFDKNGNPKKKGIIPMFFIPTGSLKITEDQISYGWSSGEQFRGRVLQPISVMAAKLSSENNVVSKESVIEDKKKQAEVLDKLQTNPDTVIFKVKGFSKGVTDSKDILTFTDLKPFVGPNMKLIYPSIDVTTKESGILNLMVNGTSMPLQKKAIGKEVALGILAYLGMDPIYISSVHGFKVGKEITNKVEALKREINRTSDKAKRNLLYITHLNQLNNAIYQGKNGMHVIYENIFEEDSLESQDLFEAIRFPDYGRDENGNVVKLDNKTFFINNTMKKLDPGKSLTEYYEQLNEIVEFLSKVSFDAGKSFVENKKDNNFVTEGDVISFKEVNTMEYLLGTKDAEGKIIMPSRYEARGIIVNNSILTGKNKYIILGDPIIGPKTKPVVKEKAKKKKAKGMFDNFGDVEFKSEYDEDASEKAQQLSDKKLQAIADVKPLLKDKEERIATVKRIKEAKDMETINKIIKEVNCR